MTNETDLKAAVERLKDEIKCGHPVYYVACLKADLRLVLAALEEKETHLALLESVREKAEAFAVEYKTGFLHSRLHTAYVNLKTALLAAQKGVGE